MTDNGARIENREELLELARRATTALGQATIDKKETALIQTNAQTLLAVSKIMDQMLRDMQACGGIDCMGRTMNGTKLWVTQDRFEVVRERCARMETALRMIAMQGNHDDTLEMLIDWRETALALRRLAHAALD